MTPGPAADHDAGQGLLADGHLGGLVGARRGQGRGGGALVVVVFELRPGRRHERGRGMNELRAGLAGRGSSGYRAGGGGGHSVVLGVVADEHWVGVERGLLWVAVDHITRGTQSTEIDGRVLILKLIIHLTSDYQIWDGENLYLQSVYLIFPVGEKLSEIILHLSAHLQERIDFWKTGIGQKPAKIINKLIKL